MSVNHLCKLYLHKVYTEIYTELTLIYNHSTLNLAEKPVATFMAADKTVFNPQANLTDSYNQLKHAKVASIIRGVDHPLRFLLCRKSHEYK